MNVESRADVRKRIKESFFGSEERLRLLTDSFKEGIVVLDRDGDVAFWNQGAERILGYTEQEVLGKDPVSLMAPTMSTRKLFRSLRMHTSKQAVSSCQPGEPPSSWHRP